MTVIEFVLVLSVILIVVTGWCVGIWHVIHHLRRKHRLEREADDRAHKRALAEDFTEISKQLGEGSLNFGDYLSTRPSKEIEKGQ